MTTKILVVDDSAMVRRQVASALKTLGYAVVEAADGLDALEKLDASPDLAQFTPLWGRMVRQIRSATAICHCLASRRSQRLPGRFSRNKHLSSSSCSPTNAFWTSANGAAAGSRT